MQLLRVCACAFAAEGLGVKMFVYDIVAVAAQAGALDLHGSRSAAIESHFTLALHVHYTHVQFHRPARQPVHSAITLQVSFRLCPTLIRSMPSRKCTVYKR
jgi:hypothetical protein